MAFRTFSQPILVRPAREGSTIDYYTADEAIKQGQLLIEGPTAGQVSPSDTDGERVVGFALYDAAEGAQVAVAESGTAVRATSGTGTVSEGDPIASHGGTGEEGEVDTAASGDYVLGRAISEDNGDGATVEVRVEPEGFVYGGSPA